MFQQISRFQSDDPRFVAAAMDLGMPMQISCMKHLDADSQKHGQTFVTYSLSSNGEMSPNELYTLLLSGGLLAQNPAHPVFAALAGIDNFLALRGQLGFPLSLVPLQPRNFQQGLNRVCLLRPRRQNDGDLGSGECVGRHIDLDLPAAAVAALCAFPFGFGAPASSYRVYDGPSRAFPGLSLAALLRALMAYDHVVKNAAQTSGPLQDRHGTMALDIDLPGFLPGDHPVLHAYNAILIFARLTGLRLKPQTFFFTSEYSAMIPVDSNQDTIDLTERFLTEGAAVFLKS